MTADEAAHIAGARRELNMPWGTGKMDAEAWAVTELGAAEGSIPASR
jgi:hypothetical protein